MSQMSLLGGEIPVEDLELGPIQRLLAQRERALEGSDPLTDDEAGAAIHARQGKHSEDTRCQWCAVDGADALERLRARQPKKQPRNIHGSIPAAPAAPPVGPEPPL